MLSSKRKALVKLKNIPGWKTKRKLVIFSVDDYGNVRMASSEARKNLEQAGLNVAQNRFDRFDCLEDSRDLEQLFDSLSSVKDRRGNPAVFTAFALPANIDFDKVIEVNLKSVFNMTKAVQRTMLKQRKGSIINMSSVVGLKGNAGQSNYAASKAGIIGFSKSIALELGSRNIRCNVIAPGFIETEMTAKLDEKTVDVWRNAIPLKRGGAPEDIANACVFLASDLSAYITGQTLNVDGGMLT